MKTNEPAAPNPPLPVTAVSLGSNGFHLISAIRNGDALETIAHLHENVQVESCLDDKLMISPIGLDRICGALGRFAKHLQANPSSVVKAIATGSFRKAKNTEAIIAQASQQLGHPIKVLSGRDESLLCYIGIASSVGLSDQNRLVIDIGGGSTELMIANKNQLIEYCSVDLGCVSLTKGAFGNEKIDNQNLEQAIRIASDAFKPYVKPFLDQGWSEVMGCGGTVTNLFAILRVWRLGGTTITTAGLEKFACAVLETGSAKALGESIALADRIPLLPAGAALLTGIYRQFGIERAKPVFSSVSQGLVVELSRQQKNRKWT